MSSTTHRGTESPTNSSIDLVKEIFLNSDLDNLNLVLNNLQTNRRKIVLFLSEGAIARRTRKLIIIRSVVGVAAVGIASGISAIFSSQILSSSWNYVFLEVVVFVSVALLSSGLTLLINPKVLLDDETYAQRPETEALLEDYLETCQRIKTNQGMLSGD